MFFTAEYEWGKQVGEGEEGCTVSQEGRILAEPPCHPMDIIYSQKCVFLFPLALTTLPVFV